MQHEAYLLSCGITAPHITSETAPAARITALDCLRRRALAVLIVFSEQIACNSRVVCALERCCVEMVVFDEAHTWLAWLSWRPAMARAPGVLCCVRRLEMTATLRCSSAPLLQEARGMEGSDVARHYFFGANLALRVEHRPPSIFERGGTASRS